MEVVSSVKVGEVPESWGMEVGLLVSSHWRVCVGWDMVGERVFWSC